MASDPFKKQVLFISDGTDVSRGFKDYRTIGNHSLKNKLDKSQLLGDYQPHPLAMAPIAMTQFGSNFLATRLGAVLYGVPEWQDRFPPPGLLESFGVLWWIFVMER